jgi:hypothetical protein
MSCGPRAAGRRLEREALDSQLASALADPFHFPGARRRRIADAVLARIGF